MGDEVQVQVLDVDMDRERISLGLKQTQEDPWKTLVKGYPVGTILQGKVTKLVPFGAFVALGDGVEGLVHISEMSRDHVEKPEDILSVGDEVTVKVMDIDLERRRISLSLKQANEGTIGEAVDFDPTLYGMSASYDDAGNYQYPEGFDQETNEWLPGHETAQAEWERQYAEAKTRFDAHQEQVVAARKADAEAGTEAPASYSSEAPAADGATEGDADTEADTEAEGGAPAPAEGALASDEALAALREKLTGGGE